MNHWNSKIKNLFVDIEDLALQIPGNSVIWYVLQTQKLNIPKRLKFFIYQVYIKNGIFIIQNKCNSWINYFIDPGQPAQLIVKNSEFNLICLDKLIVLGFGLKFLMVSRYWSFIFLSSENFINLFLKTSTFKHSWTNLNILSHLT